MTPDEIRRATELGVRASTIARNSGRTLREVHRIAHSGARGRSGTMIRACAHCARPTETRGSGPTVMCARCRTLSAEARTAACLKVRKAIRAGTLKPAHECTCVDCGAPAREYDHRDYAKPLEVVPVCRGCNIRRGPAAFEREDAAA